MPKPLLTRQEPVASPEQRLHQSQSCPIMVDKGRFMLNLIDLIFESAISCLSRDKRAVEVSGQLSK